MTLEQTRKYIQSFLDKRELVLYNINTRCIHNLDDIELPSFMWDVDESEDKFMLYYYFKALFNYLTNQNIDIRHITQCNDNYKSSLNDLAILINEYLESLDLTEADVIKIINTNIKTRNKTDVVLYY